MGTSLDGPAAYLWALGGSGSRQHGFRQRRCPKDVLKMWIDSHPVPSEGYVPTVRHGAPAVLAKRLWLSNSTSIRG